MQNSKSTETTAVPAIGDEDYAAAAHAAVAVLGIELGSVATWSKDPPHSENPDQMWNVIERRRKAASRGATAKVKADVDAAAKLLTEQTPRSNQVLGVLRSIWSEARYEKRVRDAFSNNFEAADAFLAASKRTVESWNSEEKAAGTADKLALAILYSAFVRGIEPLINIAEYKSFSNSGKPGTPSKATVRRGIFARVFRIRSEETFSSHGSRLDRVLYAAAFLATVAKTGIFRKRGKKPGEIIETKVTGDVLEFVPATNGGDDVVRVMPLAFGGEYAADGGMWAIDPAVKLNDKKRRSVATIDEHAKAYLEVPKRASKGKLPAQQQQQTTDGETSPTTGTSTAPVVETGATAPANNETSKPGAQPVRGTVSLAKLPAKTLLEAGYEGLEQLCETVATNKKPPSEDLRAKVIMLAHWLKEFQNVLKTNCPAEFVAFEKAMAEAEAEGAKAAEKMAADAAASKNGKKRTVRANGSK